MQKPIIQAIAKEDKGFLVEKNNLKVRTLQPTVFKSIHLMIQWDLSRLNFILKKLTPLIYERLIKTQARKVQSLINPAELYQ